jgi:hypothetical protein
MFFQLCDDKFLKKGFKNIIYVYSMDTLGLQMGDKKAPKSAENFVCNLCDFRCSKQSGWERHCLTLKHKMVTKGLQNGDNLAPKSATPFMCSCGKQYNYRQGLSRHNKICIKEEQKEYIDGEIEDLKPVCTNDKDQLINYLIKENQEFKNLILEIVKKDTTTTNNNCNTNSHNKAFNLNFFLNETCKDAMNIMDFVESIQLQLSDLENVGEKGYVEGISDIIIKNLKNLDVTKRPVHCTDKKRETLYVKDDDKWEKDNENAKMHKMIKKVQDKNIRMIKKFKEKYPDYHKSTSKHSDAYNNIIIESMGGRGNNDFEKEERIIKKVSKAVGLDK